MHLDWKRGLVAVAVLCLPAAGASGQSIRAAAETEAAAAATEPPAVQTAPPPLAFDYSDGYRLRARIHKASSLATLPLFATEGFIGQSLYSKPTSGKKDAHLAVAAGIGALFAVNSVTGVWNLVEARKDPIHRQRRLLHGLLMLGADAGFVTTAATASDMTSARPETSRLSKWWSWLMSAASNLSCGVAGLV
jgi:hypothetical protein